MQETMRTDIYADIKYYDWNVIDDTTQKLTTIIQPNTPLKNNLRELNKDYNRHRIMNYYYEDLIQRPKFDFQNLNKNDRHIINNYYYEYLNKFNELSDRIINSNESCFITGPGGSGKTTLLKQLQDRLKQKDKNISPYVQPT
jgi:DNA replication protein DnaC